MATASSLTGPFDNAYDTVAASATDSVLVAAVATKKIRVLTYMINQGDTTPSSVQFNSKGGGAGTSIWPAVKYPANGGAQPPLVQTGMFETNVGEGLTVTTGAGSNTGIAVTFTLVAP
jgi:hypothetical protein